jgi:adenosine deaminase
LQIRFLVLLAATAILSGCVTPAVQTADQSTSGADTAEARTALYFDRIRDEPVVLNMFLRGMPKGADLHNHLSGAVYAESFLDWAARDGLCISRVQLTIFAPPCDVGRQIVPAAEVQRDKSLYNAAVNAFSMRNFVPGAQSGHDHFFAAFDKFSRAGDSRPGDMLAEAIGIAAADNVSYLELMWSTPGMGAARRLGATVGWNGNFDAMRPALLRRGISGIVGEVGAYIAAAETRMRDLLHCAEPGAAPGCRLTVRYLAQVVRTLPPEQVFAQCLLGFELASRQSHFVGLNLVAPEDDLVALRDYATHMHMLAYLRQHYPEVKLSLHAGELRLGLVPPNDLRSHIRQAVEIAGARRIGHGFDVMQEDNAADLLRDMAKRHVLVEINLTSNDLILGVRGREHPLKAYMHAGVPVAISTDDEGVSRIDLTNEYRRAATEQGLSYRDLKMLARNSLEYAFLPGASLWQSNRPGETVEACAASVPGTVGPEGACRALLDGSERARLQWELEAQFRNFEAAGRQDAP